MIDLRQLTIRTNGHQPLLFALRIPDVVLVLADAMTSGMDDDVRW